MRIGESILDELEIGFGVLLFGALISLSVRLVFSRSPLKVLARVKQQLIEQNRQLEAARIDAEAANQAKTQFLSSMSHELRTPLNAVIGYAQLLEMDNRWDGDTQDNIKEIRMAGDHLLGLVNDVLDLATIESGKLSLDVQSIRVNEVVLQMLSLAAPTAKRYGIRVETRSQSADEPNVMADPARLRQVLLNLVSNGIKYNRPQGEVCIESQRINSTTLRISVIDTGIGIPVDKQSRLFTAFDRLGNECLVTEGVGIGLVIAKRMIEAMDGRIGFESVERRGSTFWVELPLAS